MMMNIILRKLPSHHGEISIMLSKRVTVHNQQIRDITTRMLQVSTHVDNYAQAKTSKYHIFPFIKMQTDSVVSRKQREAVHIRTLRPVLNTERTGH